MSRFFFASLGLAMLVGCTPTREVLRRRPEVRAVVTAIDARELTRQHADLVLSLELENPGPELSLTGAEYQILAQGRIFAAGASVLRLTLPAGGRSRLSLPIQLAYLELPGTARARPQENEKIQLVARGVLRGTTAASSEAVEFDGSTEATLSEASP